MLCFKVSLVVFALILLEASSTPARVRRQFIWGEDDNTSPSSRPPIEWTEDQPNRPRPTRQQLTSTTDEAPTTSTTASPRFAACLAQCQATSEYNPICGSDRQTYSNMNRLRCANRCGANVQVLFNGQCRPL